MYRLLISLLTCTLVFGHIVSAQAAIYEYEYDPDDIVMEAPDPMGSNFPNVGYTFDVTGEINDLSLITSATLSVYFNDIDPGVSSVHSSRVGISGYTLGWPFWGESNFVAVYTDNPNVLSALQSVGSFSMYVYFDPLIISTFDPYAFDKAELTVETSAVPVPGAIWLFGSGLASLVGLRRKRK